MSLLIDALKKAEQIRKKTSTASADDGLAFATENTPIDSPASASPSELLDNHLEPVENTDLHWPDSDEFDSEPETKASSEQLKLADSNQINWTLATTATDLNPNPPNENPNGIENNGDSISKTATDLNLADQDPSANTESVFSSTLTDAPLTWNTGADQISANEADLDVPPVTTDQNETSEHAAYEWVDDVLEKDESTAVDQSPNAFEVEDTVTAMTTETSTRQAVSAAMNTEPSPLEMLETKVIADDTDNTARPLIPPANKPAAATPGVTVNTAKLNIPNQHPKTGQDQADSIPSAPPTMPDISSYMPSYNELNNLDQPNPLLVHNPLQVQHSRAPLYVTIGVLMFIASGIGYYFYTELQRLGGPQRAEMVIPLTTPPQGNLASRINPTATAMPPVDMVNKEDNRTESIAEKIVENTVDKPQPLPTDQLSSNSVQSEPVDSSMSAASANKPNSETRASSAAIKQQQDAETVQNKAISKKVLETKVDDQHTVTLSSSLDKVGKLDTQDRSKTKPDPETQTKTNEIEQAKQAGDSLFTKVFDQISQTVAKQFTADSAPTVENETKQTSPTETEPSIAAKPSKRITPEAMPEKAEFSIYSQKQNATLDMLLQKAYQSYLSQDDEEAEKYYAKVVRINPEIRDALLGLAAVRTRLKKYGQARQAYRLVLRRYPDDKLAVTGLALLDDNQNEEQQWRKKVYSIKKQIKETPASANLHFALGSLYMRRERWKEAQKSYFEAYRYANDRPDYAYNLAISLEKINKNRSALRYYRIAEGLALSGQKVRFSLDTLRIHIQDLNDKQNLH